MSKDISEIEFTIFDLETTGLDPQSGDRIIEVAAVRFRDEQRLGEFQSLVNPGQKAVSPGAFAVNQISQQMLEQAPEISEVLPKFSEFISGSCLASYNAPFDFDFLSSELILTNNRFPDELQIVDILTMVKRMLPGLERYALESVANHLGVKSIQEHRALSDAKLATQRESLILNNFLACLV